VLTSTVREGSPMKLDDRKFLTATEKEILEGQVTDVYFQHTLQILKAKGLENVIVHAEISANSLPDGYRWAVLCGLREVVNLLEGRKLTFRAYPEGSIFKTHDENGHLIPIAVVEGPYSEFCILETPLLGLMCQASGVATKAARIKKLAGDKIVASFGIRRMHPAIAPMISYAAFIGGCDFESCVLSANLLGETPRGTMPHSLLIIFKALTGKEENGWKAFDEVIDPSVKRICLCDTFEDERFSALKAAKTLGKKLFAVRFDTPKSRRGSMREIIKETLWELKVAGYDHVGIFVSGGVNEETVKELRDLVIGFGVGTSISNAPTIDFAMDITAVKVNGKWIPISKRGKLPGIKKVYRCNECLADIVVPADEKPPKCPYCNMEMTEAHVTYIENGKKIAEIPSPQEIRRKVLENIRKVPL